MPSVFARAPPVLAEQHMFGNAARDMKWLYIGERGSRSGSHVRLPCPASALAREPCAPVHCPEPPVAAGGHEQLLGLALDRPR